MRTIVPFLVAAAISVAPAMGQASKPAVKSVVAQGKAATALVEVADGTGSAFCIDPSGLFVTNLHVVESVTGQQEVVLVLNPGEANEKKLKATVLRADEKTDLAILKAKGAAGLPTLELGASDQLVETQELMAFGFPFGVSLASDKDKYPNISVSTGKITSLRKSDGNLVAIQLDASLNPGNSGGPLVDKDGKVVGVVVAGIRGTGLNFAIPGNFLKDFLSKPELDFTPPVLNAANRSRMTAFAVRAITFSPTRPALSVEMTLTAGGQTRRVPMTSDGNWFRASLVPVPAPEGPKELHLDVQHDSTRIVGTTGEVTLTVAGKAVLLSQVHLIERDPRPRVTLLDGNVLEGEPAGLGKVEVKILGSKAVLDLAKAQRVEVADTSSVDSLDYKIVATEKGKVIRELEGTIPVEGVVVAGAGGGRALRELTLDLGGKASMKLVLIPAGRFQMGSPANEKDRFDDEGPQHEVTISKAYYMGIYPVTQEQYERMMGSNPSRFRGALNPVEQVSWDEAVEFCRRLLQKSGKTVRLPTEAEWEYACRAGSRTRRFYGDDADDARLTEYTWNKMNSGARMHPVGQKKPNNWGLYDMHGNVWQFCADWYGPYEKQAQTDPKGPASGRNRVGRGGRWDEAPQRLRSAARGLRPPGDRVDIMGFRVVVELK